MSMTDLRHGDRGPAVLELQLLLLMTGHDPGPIDGVFGPRTLAAWSGLAESRGWVEENGPTVDVSDGDMAMLRAIPRRAVELPRILTPITAVDMRIALVAGYMAGDPGGPGTEHMGNAVRVALAQLCVEHGCEAWDGRQWAKLDDAGHLPRPWLTPFQAGAQTYVYVWSNNIGNRQVSRGDRGLAQSGPEMPTIPWFSMSPMEGSGSSAHKVTSAHYAYPNAAEGAAAYWRFLRDHCGPTLAAFEAGDPAAAAHELKVGAWRYSGDEGAYMKAMIDRFNHLET